MTSFWSGVKRSPAELGSALAVAASAGAASTVGGVATGAVGGVVGAAVGCGARVGVAGRGTLVGGVVASATTAAVAALDPEPDLGRGDGADPDRADAGDLEEGGRDLPADLDDHALGAGLDRGAEARLRGQVLGGDPPRARLVEHHRRAGALAVGAD